MMRLFALAAALGLAALLLACQGGGGAPQPTTTPTLTAAAPSPTPTAAPPTATPSPTPEVERAPRLIFLRPRPDGLGVIHMSDLDGSNVIQLTPADVLTSFVGLAERDGSAIVYYVSAGQTGNVFTLEARDLGTGETNTVISIDLRESAILSGSLSPDGRYIAFTHRDGIDLLDLATDQRQRILTNSLAACETGPLRECYLYRATTWSPDNRLLLVGKVFYETGTAVVVDPFREPPQELNQASIGDAFPSSAAWSPAGDAFCGYGLYDEPSGLYLSKQPDWQPRNVLPEYEIYDTTDPEFVGRTVTDCACLDQRRIAFSSSSADYPAESRIAVFNVETGGASSIAAFNDDELLFTRSLVGAPGGEFVITQFILGGATEQAPQPVLVDVSTGARQPILQPGDWVVAVTQPIALPEGIVAAAPEVRPCAPLIAGCEAQVTNVAPDRLNLREGPSIYDEVIGKLSEGDIVCLTQPLLFGDEFRWWYARSESGIEGWVAQADPQEPDEPWLTPTGRKCEE